MKHPNHKIPLPKFNEVKKGIDELLLEDKWDRYKIKSSPKKFEKRLHELFTKKLGIFPQIVMPVNSDEFPFKFYRIRKKIKNMNPGLISEYSYPPNHIIKTTQRANIPYHPVFYCSDNPKTAILETIQDEKSHNQESIFYLSEWEFNAGIELKVSPFLFGNIHESSPYKIMTNQGYDNLEKMLEGYPNDEINGFKEILTFLSHMFVFENSYAISSFIAHSYLYANHNYRTDIFIYPSYQSDRKNVNFAIHPNVVMEKLKLSKVYKLRVESIDKIKETCTINISQIGRNENSILYWNGVTSKDRDEINELFN